MTDSTTSMIFASFSVSKNQTRNSCFSMMKMASEETPLVKIPQESANQSDSQSVSTEDDDMSLPPLVSAEDGFFFGDPNASFALEDEVKLTKSVTPIYSNHKHLFESINKSSHKAHRHNDLKSRKDFPNHGLEGKRTTDSYSPQPRKSAKPSPSYPVTFADQHRGDMNRAIRAVRRRMRKGGRAAQQFRGTRAKKRMSQRHPFRKVLTDDYSSSWGMMDRLDSYIMWFTSDSEAIGSYKSLQEASMGSGIPISKLEKLIDHDYLLDSDPYHHEDPNTPSPFFWSKTVNKRDVANALQFCLDNIEGPLDQSNFNKYHPVGFLSTNMTTTIGRYPSIEMASKVTKVPEAAIKDSIKSGKRVGDFFWVYGFLCQEEEEEETEWADGTEENPIEGLDDVVYLSDDGDAQEHAWAICWYTSNAELIACYHSVSKASWATGVPVNVILASLHCGPSRDDENACFWSNERLDEIGSDLFLASSQKVSEYAHPNPQLPVKLIDVHGQHVLGRYPSVEVAAEITKVLVSDIITSTTLGKPRGDFLWEVEEFVSPGFGHGSDDQSDQQLHLEENRGDSHVDYHNEESCRI